MNKEVNYQLGILGGMGPLATCKLYEKIINFTDASCDQEHLEMVIINKCSIPDRTKAIFSNGDSPVEKLKEGINELISIGCEYFIVPCNTAHYFIKDFDIKGIKFIDMIDETISYLKNKYPYNNICVLATRGTVDTKIYSKDLSLKIFYPCEMIQEQVMEIIYETKSGKNMLEKLQNIVNNDKYDIYLLACTELSIYKDQLQGNIIDALDILAVSALKKCGKKVKNFDE